jgi:uncharacterized protein YjbI with pentapeptide repeats
LNIVDHVTWRESKGEKGSRLKLDGEDLRGVFIANADLSHAILTNCNLNGAILYNCNLHATDFTGSDMYGANLFGSNYEFAKLDLGVKGNLNCVKIDFDAKYNKNKEQFLAVMRANLATEERLKKERAAKNKKETPRKRF